MGEKQCSCNNGTRFTRVPEVVREWSTIQNTTVTRQIDVLREQKCADCHGSGWLPDDR